MSTKIKDVLLVVFALLILAACAQQETIVKRNEALGVRPANSNFFEAQQINEIENWKDDPAKIVNLYILNPVTGGLLVPPIQCKGVPASSTESLEPNEGIPYRGGSSYWRVPVDGVDVLTDELAGRDGTFGEPVPYRQCMTQDGNYIDIPAMGVPYIVTSYSYTFPEATIKRDFEAEARLLKAEQIIKDGGCVDFETLVEIPCEPK